MVGDATIIIVIVIRLCTQIHLYMLVAHVDAMMGANGIFVANEARLTGDVVDEIQGGKVDRAGW
eukprot:COSAG05_NODE_290_length_12056_cov_14.204232_3_plen_64_part_00